MMLSVLISTGVLIYLAAWSADQRVQARALYASSGVTAGDKSFWEDSALWVCPVH